MSYIYNTSFERISEEDNGGAIPILSQSDLFSDLGFENLLDESSLSDIPIAGVCGYPNFTGTVANCVEPNELDEYLGLFNSAGRPFECDNSRALMNNLPTEIIKKERRLPSNINPIELSRSVGVGLPEKTIAASSKVQIVNPLEDFFRPRYKSDYFAQNGKSRKPRYVADRNGNHFITLRVPAGVRGQIRIDWLTVPDKSGDRYSMPYRFQQDNESDYVPDCNPLYLNINAEKNGIMKLYLVLIKSKQDELKNLQPLKPFRPLHDAFGIPEKNNKESSYPLTPKELIQKYQLDQSQLAFTFCALSLDGQSRIPEWDTTVFSTVLTEIAPKPSKSKVVACPQCTHVFEMPTNADNDEGNSSQETVSNKRKAYANASGKRIKKRNSQQSVPFFFT